MTTTYATYAECLTAANARAKLVGIEVAIRQRNSDDQYVIQQRHELPPADTRLIAVARPA